MRKRLVVGLILAVVLSIHPGVGLAEKGKCDWGAHPLEFHKDNYFLPATEDVSARGGQDRESEEFKFQISVKKDIFRCGGLGGYFGYTQLSLWQVYNKKESAPFRESNYNPELFVDWETDISAGNPLLLRFGAEHESNGQPIATSRSWNRFYLQSTTAWENTWLTLKVWARKNEDKKLDPNQADGDDNPDIDHYLGNWELSVRSLGIKPKVDVTVMIRKAVIVQTQTARTRHAPTTQIDLDINLTPDIDIRFQFFRGYGESLIDYDRLVTRYGIGFAFK